MNQNLVAVQMCELCGADYISKQSYCDETLECAFDEGEHLVTL